MVVVSQRLRSALWEKRRDGAKQFELARRADMHPSQFSQIVNDIIPIQPGDERVKRIAAVLGVPVTEAFTVIKERR